MQACSGDKIGKFRLREMRLSHCGWFSLHDEKAGGKGACFEAHGMNRIGV